MAYIPDFNAAYSWMGSPKEAAERDAQTATTGFQDRIMSEALPIQRMMAGGKLDKASIGNMRPMGSANAHYQQLREDMPNSKGIDQQMFQEMYGYGKQNYDMNLANQVATARQAGYDDDDLRKAFKGNPGMLGYMLDNQLIEPKSSFDMDITKALIAAGGYGAVTYANRLRKFVPQGKEIVKLLGDQGVKMRGYDNVGNRLRAPGQGVGSIKNLTVKELSDPTGPYKFTKTQAEKIVSNRSKGILPKVAGQKGRTGRLVTKWLLRGQKAARIGRLGSVAAMGTGGGFLPGLAGLALFEGGMWGIGQLLDAIGED
jgi:hypothetical protein|tara:strand:+ start:1370 stop:2311 length:942 start_codon:yes stop_codon:yes gene_type:complete